jgi:hypothetical protein
LGNNGEGKAAGLGVAGVAFLLVILGHNKVLDQVGFNLAVPLSLPGAQGNRGPRAAQ